MVDFSKASAGGKPAVTRDLPQLWSVPRMYFTRMQGWRCPGHTEVPSDVMPSWPTLSSQAQGSHLQAKTLVLTALLTVVPTQTGITARPHPHQTCPVHWP